MFALLTHTKAELRPNYCFPFQIVAKVCPQSQGYEKELYYERLLQQYQEISICYHLYKPWALHLSALGQALLASHN